MESIKHNYTLRYWINEKNIDNYGWEGLSANSNATMMLIKQIEYIKYFTEDNYKKLKSKIDWYKLLANPSILNYLLKTFELPSNTYLYSLLIDSNKSNDILILRFKDEYLKGLSSNPNAIKILEKYPDIIDYDNLFLNLNPNSSKLLGPNYKITEQLKIKKICRSHNLEEIESLKEPDWDELYSNPVMIDLIHKKVNNEKLTITEMQKIFGNPNIFITNKELKIKLKKWCNNPKINPYTEEHIKVSVIDNSEYVKLYKSFLNYLISINKPTINLKIADKLPTLHCYTFTQLDIKQLTSFYTEEQCKKLVDLKKIDFDYLFTTYYLQPNSADEFYSNFFLYRIISRQLEVNSKFVENYPDIPAILLDIMLDKDLEVFTEMVNEYIYDLCFLILPITKLSNHVELKETEYISYFEEMLGIDDNVLSYTVKHMKNRLQCIIYLVSLFGTGDIFKKLDDDTIDNDYLDIIYKCITNLNIKNFLVSAIFDIEEIHMESTKQIVYNFVKDPYDNLPDPPELPKYPVLSQELRIYKYRKLNLESNGDLINNDKDRQLEEYNKKEYEYKIQLKEYDKKLKEYNKKHLGRKVSPYFSVSINRTKDDLEYSYNSIKTTQRSLSAFNKKIEKSGSSESTLYEKSSGVVLTDDLKNKFYRYIYDGTDIENSAEREELLIELKIAELNGKISNSRAEQLRQYSGGGKKSLSAIKAELKLDKKRLDKAFKNKCDLTGNEPFTMELYANMHTKKIKYLSKIKSVINGKTYVNCYDTVNIYNYVLNCRKSGKVPENIALGRKPFTTDNLKEIFKKIKHFTKQKTLEVNDNIYKNIRLVGIAENTFDNEYIIRLNIIIGTIQFPTFVGKIDDNDDFYIYKGELFSIDETDYDNSSDKTIIVIQKGITNGRLLEQSHYPYIPTRLIKNTTNILSLPSPVNIGTLEENTRQFNNQLELLVA
tara:strand:+ start:814 stop:3639 length:2826 start_codon:yes stop_codon:yes gene_type:complete